MKLTDEQRAQRKRDSAAKLFASYKKTGNEQRGNSESWRKVAKSLEANTTIDSLKILGLVTIPTEIELKKIYRIKMLSAHPDRGGSTELAAKINEAYLELKQLLELSEASKQPNAEIRTDTGLRSQLPNMCSLDTVEKLLSNDDWCLQQKMDGRHVIIKIGKNIILAANKQGLRTEIQPEILAELMLFDDTIFDGEIIGDHYYVFDVVLKATYSKRLEILTNQFKNKTLKNVSLVKTFLSTEEKKEAFKRLKESGEEGVVLKNLTSIWAEGRPEIGGNILKYKFVSTLSAIVDNFATGRRSFAYYVFDNEGNKVNLGCCNIGSKTIPKAGSVVEIRYLYVVKEGGSLVQPFFIRVRDDVDPKDCLTSQIKYKGRNL